VLVVVLILSSCCVYGRERPVWLCGVVDWIDRPLNEQPVVWSDSWSQQRERKRETNKPKVWTTEKETQWKRVNPDHLNKQREWEKKTPITGTDPIKLKWTASPNTGNQHLHGYKSHPQKWGCMGTSTTWWLWSTDGTHRSILHFRTQILG